jgi:hypothetical protein
MIEWFFATLRQYPRIAIFLALGPLSATAWLECAETEAKPTWDMPVSGVQPIRVLGWQLQQQPTQLQRVRGLHGFSGRFVGQKSPLVLEGRQRLAGASGRSGSGAFRWCLCERSLSAFR